MLYLDNSIKRIESIIETIDVLKQTDFPYESPKKALDKIEKRFNFHLERLKRLKEAPTQASAAMINACAESLNEISNCLPILGFISNSANIRNPFETYAPLLRLSRKALEPESELIISSEWFYSPFVTSYYVIPEFVMLGLPAQESENPLLIPLSGHELGHCIWALYNQRENLKDKIREKLYKIVKEIYLKDIERIFSHLTESINTAELENDLYINQLLAEPFEMAIKHTMEIFCDFIGLKLFSEAYLYAISYIMAPNPSRRRSPNYPKNLDRMHHLLDCAKDYGVSIPPDFLGNFTEEPEPIMTMKLYFDIADDTSRAMVPYLIVLAKEIIESKSIPNRSQSEVAREVNLLKKRIPISSATSISDIVNAGWICYLDDTIWLINEIKPEEKDRLIKELILKSFEVYEVERRLKSE